MPSRPRPRPHAVFRHPLRWRSSRAAALTAGSVFLALGATLLPAPALTPVYKDRPVPLKYVGSQHEHLGLGEAAGTGCAREARSSRTHNWSCQWTGTRGLGKAQRQL